MGDDPFSIQWTREAIEDVVDKGIGHVSQVSACIVSGLHERLKRSTQSHVLWHLQRDWELEVLESLTPDERLRPCIVEGPVIAHRTLDLHTLHTLNVCS